MKKTIIFAFLIFCSISIFSEISPFTLDSEPGLFRKFVPESLVIYPPVRMWTLKNGLTVLFWENHTAPVVSMRIAIKTGSMFEGEFIGSGISHYLEHVVSGGSSKKMSEKEATQFLASIGASANAYTSKDITCYYITGPSDKFGAQLERLADCVMGCLFDSAEVAREKGVIMQEIYKDMEEPGSILYDLFNQTVYKTHPVRHPIIGYIENFKRITRQNLIDYYHSKYSPDNSIVAIAGDVDFGTVDAMVDSLFGPWERRTTDLPTLPAEPIQLSARYAEASATVKTCQMRIGWRGAERGTRDSYALDVLADILTDGKMSRLHKRLVIEEKLCKDVWASHMSSRNIPSSFSIGVSDFDFENRDKILEIIWEEIDKIKKKGATTHELEREKKLILKGMMFENETVEGQSSSMLFSFLTYGRPFALDFVVPNYISIDLDEIKKVANEYILPNRMTVVLLRPQVEKEQKEFELKKKTGLEFSKHKLSNGMTLLVAENRNVPHFDIKMFFIAGLRLEPSGLMGVSNLTAEYLLEGVRGYPTPEKLTEYIEWNGYYVSTDGGNNTISLSGKLLPMDLDAGLELLAKMAFEPVFPQKSLPRLKKQASMKLIAQENQWSSEIFYLYRRLYFRGHPYAGNPTGSLESIEKITLDDIKAFHNRFINPSNCALAIAGPMEKKKLITLIEKMFGKYKGRAVEFPEVSKSPARTEPEIFVKETGRAQTTIMIGFPAPSMTNPDKYAMAVFDGILSGLQGRLHEALRGERDLVYLVWGSSFIGFDEGTYYVMTQTSPENYDTVVAVIMSEIEKMKRGDFNEDDIATAKTIIREEFNRGRQKQENFVVSSALDELYGLGFDYDEKYLAEIDKITKEQVVDFAAKYFNNPVTVVVAPVGFANKLGVKPISN